MTLHSQERSVILRRFERTPWLAPRGSCRLAFLFRDANETCATFSDKDFRLGLKAAQTTLGAIAKLTDATLIKAGR